MEPTSLCSPKPGSRGKCLKAHIKSHKADEENRYPKGNDAAWIANHVADYIENSLEVGSSEWYTLVNAAKTNQIYLALGFSEKTNASIYMAQALISPCGEVLHHRQKVRPSGGERDIWSDGDMSGLKVLDTPYGRWGMLECWEYVSTTYVLTL